MTKHSDEQRHRKETGLKRGSEASLPNRALLTVREGDADRDLSRAALNRRVSTQAPLFPSQWQLHRLGHGILAYIIIVFANISWGLLEV